MPGSRRSMPIGIPMMCRTSAGLTRDSVAVLGSTGSPAVTALRDLQRGARAVRRLEAQLVERRLQRLDVARAGERRPAHRVDPRGLLGQRFLAQDGLGLRGDLDRSRLVALQ